MTEQVLSNDFLVNMSYHVLSSQAMSVKQWINRRNRFMTNKEILQIALQQSAIDSNCDAADFLSEKSKLVISKKNETARKYLELPFLCDFTSYGNNIVASVSEQFENIAKKYIERFPAEHCFETPNMHVLMNELRPMGVNVCFMAEYFLPDVNMLTVHDCKYEIRKLGRDGFADLYLPQWSNALCEKRKELDMIAFGAFDSGKLVGLAGCSADCDAMWQIGVDVLPEYRRQGIACALTSRLAVEILENGKVPFYCAAWCNVRSVRNAVKSGFKPAWVQMTVKSEQFIESLNQ